MIIQIKVKKIMKIMIRWKVLENRMKKKEMKWKR